MGILGLATERVKIPHEPDSWMDLSTELPPIALIRAKQAREHQDLEKAAAVLAVMTADQLAAVAPQAPATQAETNGGLSKEQVCLDTAAVELITAWSYTHPRTGRAIPVSVEMVRRLDAATREWIHEQAWDALRRDGLAGN